MSQTGSLYIVATPIGNLGDITHRAITILCEVDLIAAEDTRHSKGLLNHYHIHTPTISLHEHNEKQRLTLLLSKLAQGQQIALISDAGTPLISDPGYVLVNAVWQAGFRVIPIPGPCAAITALVASGLATDRFVFEGFLPHKAFDRKRRLLALREEMRTIILYESVYRMSNLMQLLTENFEKDRIVVVARELTKIFESIQRGYLYELQEWWQKNPEQHKGEFVVLLEGATMTETEENIDEYRRVLKILLAKMSLKEAVFLATQLSKGKRSLLYRLALEIKKGE